MSLEIDINQLITNDYENSKAYGEPSDELMKVMTQVGNSIYPDGMPESIEIVPHTQTLSGEGNVFILVDKNQSLLGTKYVKLSPSGMQSTRATSLIPELQKDFDYQLSIVGKEMNVQSTNGTAHNANTAESVFAIDAQTEAILMRQVVESENLLPQLNITGELKNDFTKKSTQQLAVFLKSFLDEHSEAGTFPKDWGLETIKTRKPEFKGVGFFPESLRELDPKIGVYDFAVDERPYASTTERDFLCNLPAFILAMNGHTDKLGKLDDFSPSHLRVLSKWPAVQEKFLKDLRITREELNVVFGDLGFSKMVEALEEALKDSPPELEGTREWTNKALASIVSAI